MLLDEPTSHLDTYSQIALEKAIEAYKGTVLMVSHDFYNIVNCCDYVLFVDNKTVRSMRMRNFRKMVYDKYFDQKYLEIDRKKQQMEEEKMLAHEKKIEADIDNYLQELVSSRGYDDVKSCVGYYSSTDETFQREARAISKHRDQLYRKGYDLIAQCKKGEIDYKIIDLQYILNLIDPLDW